MIFDNGACFILFFINMPINPIISICFFVTSHFFTLALSQLTCHTVMVLIPQVSRPLWGLWFLFSFHREIRCYLLQRPYSNSRRSQRQRQALLLIIPGDVPFVRLRTTWQSLIVIIIIVINIITLSSSVSVSVSVSVSETVLVLTHQHYHYHHNYSRRL